MKKMAVLSCVKKPTNQPINLPPSFLPSLPPSQIYAPELFGYFCLSLPLSMSATKFYLHRKQILQVMQPIDISKWEICDEMLCSGKL